MNTVQPQSETFLRAIRLPILPASLIIFTIAFAIRLLFALHTPLDLTIGEPRNIALALLDHRGFSDPYAIPTGPTAHCNPFLPAFVAGVYSLFGGGYSGELVRCLICIAILSLSYALLPLFAVRLGFPTTIGAVAGLTCAVFPFKRTSETVSFFEEPFTAICLLLLFLYTWKLLRKRTLDWRDGLLYGVAWGLTFYISASVLLVFMGFGLLLAVGRGLSRIRQVAVLAIAPAAALLIIAPWTVRNYQALHAIMFMRSNFGLELALAFNDGASPTLKQNLLSGYQGSHHPLISTEEAMSVRNLGEVEYNRRKADQARRWIHEHPLESMDLTVQRIVSFWGGQRLDYATAIPNGLLSLFAFVGCLLIYRSNPDLGRLFIVVFILGPLTYYLAQMSPRLSLSIHPLVAFAASYAVWETREQFLRRRRLSPAATD